MNPGHLAKHLTADRHAIRFFWLYQEPKPKRIMWVLVFKRKIMNQSTLVSLFDFDMDTGIFTWKTGQRKGMKAGTLTKIGYIQIRIGKNLFRAHRLAWLYCYGCFPSFDIDHIDGNKENNKISNLRDVEKYVNSQNKRKARSDNKTGILGVCKRKDKYRAQIYHSGKVVHLGFFDHAEDAKNAYLNAKRLFHAGNTL